MSKMSEGLCRRCYHYQHVEFHELGRVLEGCRAAARDWADMPMFNQVRAIPSRVINCTQFTEMDAPMLFAGSAWRWDPDKHTFIDPKKEHC